MMRRSGAIVLMLAWSSGSWASAADPQQAAETKPQGSLAKAADHATEGTSRAGRDSHQVKEPASPGPG